MVGQVQNLETELKIRNRNGEIERYDIYIYASEFFTAE